MMISLILSGVSLFIIDPRKKKILENFFPGFRNSIFDFEINQQQVQSEQQELTRQQQDPEGNCVRCARALPPSRVQHG